MSKTLLPLFAIAALLAGGCASSSHVAREPSGYTIECRNWKSACTQKADALCGAGNYKVLSDKRLNCISTGGGASSCTWALEVECAQSAPAPDTSGSR